jgi:hypothetical protein
MMSNVPQDVESLILGADDLISRREAITAIDEYTKRWDGEIVDPITIRRILKELREQRAGGEAVFGYYWQTVHEKSGQVVNSGFVKEWEGDLRQPDKLDGYFIEATPLCRQPQPALDFAAGMMKAAEIIRAKVDPDKTQISEQWNGLCNDFADEILSAIPKESADALKEYVSGKCMEVAQSVFRKKWNRELSVFAHEDELAAIVNSVLEGKS